MENRQKYLKLQNGINSISKAMLSNVYASAEGENVICSPFSFVMALAILLNAVKGDSRNEIQKAVSNNLSVQEITEALGRLQKELSSSDTICRFVSSNGVCVKAELMESMLDEFKDVVVNSFDAELFAADSDMLERINAWVSKKTDGMIPRLIDNEIPDLKVALINAVSFMAEWEEEYEPDDIYEEMDFTNFDRSVSKVTMLNSCEGEYVENSAYKGVIKNYKDGKYAFMGLLPKRKGKTFFNKALDDADFTELYNSREEKEVYTEIPEFEINRTMELTPFCNSLGINTVFTEQADFSGMTSKGPLMVDSILQKAYIKVDRAGTKAAAATVEICVAGCAMDFMNTKEVYFDRPFVYAIINRETGIPVFSGVVNKL